MKKFFNSSYFKAATVLLICGGILIAFNKWISTTKFSVGFDALHNALIPVYIGIVCAFLLCPLYNLTVNKVYKLLSPAPKDINGSKVEEDPKKNRKSLIIAKVVATIFSMAVLIGVGAFVIYTILPQTISSIVDLLSNLPERLMSLSNWLAKNFKMFPQLSIWVAQLAETGTAEIFTWIQENLFSINDATTMAETISSGVITAFGVIMDIFIGLVISVFLLVYKDKLFAIGHKLVAALFSDRKQAAIFEFMTIINDTFIGYIIGRIIDSAIIGVLTYVCMSIFGMPFASMISVIVGITNVIPFFGPFIGAIPSVMIIMLEDPVMALWFIVMIFLIQQLDGNVIGPKIVGDVLGISSFWILISVLIGGGLFGFIGMALGVPVFAIIYKYIDKYATKSLENKGQPSKADDYVSLEPYGIDVDTVELSPITREKKTRKKKEKREDETTDAE